jgi:uncharacterized protein (DUF2062 family)
MAKKLLKRYLPNTRTIREHKHLQIFGTLLHDPNLWHLNRYSVATAFSVGLFVAFVPIPFQMVLAAAIAIIFRANLPISAALVWVSNPITMPPLFYSAYKLGGAILGRTPGKFNFELTFEWLLNGLGAIWQPFLLGCFICGSLLAIFGNLFIRALWRYSVSRDWNIRKLKRIKKWKIK